MKTKAFCGILIVTAVFIMSGRAHAQAVNNLVFTEDGLNVTETLNGVLLNSFSVSNTGYGDFLGYLAPGSANPSSGTLSNPGHHGYAFALGDPLFPGYYTYLLVNGTSEYYSEKQPLNPELGSPDPVVQQLLNGVSGGKVTSSDSLPAFGDVYFGGQWIPANLSLEAVPEPNGLLSTGLLGLSICWLAVGGRNRHAVIKLMHVFR